MEQYYLSPSRQKKSALKNKLDIQIVPYHHDYKKAFKALNEEWIVKYFVLEASDKKSLDYPLENIINKGGKIYFALIDNIAVGVCALVKADHPQYDFELSKMGVTKRYQGKGIGKQLIEKVLSEAKRLGGRNIFLESNRTLAPAINMYKKFGFTEIDGFSSTYERSNIQMVLVF